MVDKQNFIFSLDIGTRKVMGIIAQKVDKKLRVVDIEIMEHSSRTMLDGQIHNIAEVAKIVGTIKQRLEKRINLPLERVGVAVAGRALRTVQAKIEKNISSDEEIYDDDVRNLELEAVSSVLRDVSHDFGQGDYYCVGYSVVYYELDGAPIENLVGHFGRSMAVEVIATFLPRVVLDSMLSVLRKNGLEVINLTLEPIAAINAIIPKDMRRLNLALVDIGAGTSDIALTSGGSVVAYGMVPEAGDEITELLCEKYILDFSSAERIKRLITSQPKVNFRDILGKSYELDSKDIIAEIQPRVKALAASIAGFLLELNQKAPHAVILVGGGSLTPILDKEIAHSLSLEEAKVGVRLPDVIECLDDKTGRLKGPDMVTPVGISIMTSQSQGLKFVELYVNEKRVQVLDMKQHLDILGALVAAGVDRYKLYGRIGQAVCVEVNGELKVIKGKAGKPARFKLNDQSAELTDIVKNQDRITFEEAEDGEDAQGKVKDILGDLNIQFIVNGQTVEVQPKVKMNGMPITGNVDLIDRACIEYGEGVEIKKVLEAVGIDTNILEDREIVVRVNREPKILSQSNYHLLVDGQRTVLTTKVCNASNIEFRADNPQFYRIKDVISIPAVGKSITVRLNDKEYVIDGKPGRISMNGHLVEPEEFLIDRAEIITSPGEDAFPIVSHILKHFPVNPEDHKGEILKISVNGKPGGFTTQLSEGSEVRMHFTHRSSSNIKEFS
ncbi:MAG: hypothetical protein GY853_02870 [PVC group bacterium]|nr:hypothetical protein [PVC group bacterium]